MPKLTVSFPSLSSVFLRKCQKMYVYVLTVTFILMSLYSTLGPLFLYTGLPPRGNTKISE